MAPPSPTSMVFLPKSRRMRPWTFLCLRPGSNLLLGHSAMHAEELLKKSLLWKKHTTKIISKIHNFLCSEMYIYICIYHISERILPSENPGGLSVAVGISLHVSNVNTKQIEATFCFLWAASCNILISQSVKLQALFFKTFPSASDFFGLPKLSKHLPRNKYLHLKPMKPPEKPLLSSMEKAHRATLPTLLGWRTSAPNDSYEASPFHLANQYPR